MSSQLLTPANQITILRMAFIPVFVILLVYNHLGWAFFVFLLAGITDGLDGLMARWLQQKTSLGAMLDPIADIVIADLLVRRPCRSKISSCPICCRSGSPSWSLVAMSS